LLQHDAAFANFADDGFGFIEPHPSISLEPRR
jgi:hypothetical protein